MFSDKATLLKHFGLQSKSLGEINTHVRAWQHLYHAYGKHCEGGRKSRHYNVASYIQCEVMMTAFVCQVHLLYTHLVCPGSGQAVMMFSFTHNPLIMFWISQVLFNLVDLPFKGEMLIIMTISHKWNWSSPLCFYCGYFLFIWTDVSYSQESVSSAGIIPQGCCSFTQPPPSLDGGLKYWSCMTW